MTEEINLEQIRKISKLARIKLSDDEAMQMLPEISSIITVINSLHSVNTDNITPTINVMNHDLPLREDEVTDGHKPEEILSNAPLKEYNCFVVPKVIEVNE